MTRILLKLSGEALGDAHSTGIDATSISALCSEIGALHAAGVEIGLVVGAGNLIRGAELSATGMDRVTGDQIGMLATIMNGLALGSALQVSGVPSVVYSAFQIPGVVRTYVTQDARRSLGAGEVCVFAGGLGNPFFTTDTAACLRGIEIEAEMVLKATKVDGVYSADPVKHADAVRYSELTYDEVLAKDLRVMDLTAICLCRDHEMPLVVFDMNDAGALTRIVNGDKVGTTISTQRTSTHSNS